MKLYNVNIPSIVYQDMREIKFYKESLGSYASTVDKLLKSFRDEFRRLETSPNIGPDLSNKIPIPTNYKYLVVQDYFIFYEVDGDEVNIIRILSAKSNWQKILF